MMFKNRRSKFVLILTSCLFGITSAFAQIDTPKLVFITLDGYRWQELFGGAEERLINNKRFGNMEQAKKRYWRETPEERREVLAPFLWNYAAKTGVMIGCRWLGCKMNVTNKMWFSFPGYSELVCGYADDARIRSNGMKPNPNVSVFEVINKLPQYHGKILTFGSWDRFSAILNEERSGLKVNCGYRKSLSKKPTKAEQYIDSIQDISPRIWSAERIDAVTHLYAMEAMKSKHPAVLWVAYGDIDEIAHAARYDKYLDAANQVDGFIEELWNYAQSDPYYENNTTFIITCDHGRGSDTMMSWTGHGLLTPHSNETWLIAFGKNVPYRGVLTSGQYYNNQVASTLASFLDVAYMPEHPRAGKPIDFFDAGEYEFYARRGQ